MGVTLAKGGNVSLSKAAPNLTKVQIGLGWRARSTTGADFDLDASALLCANGRVLGDEYFVFYNNLKSPEGSVEHTGDELVGGSGGDDETILVDLAAVPELRVAGRSPMKTGQFRYGGRPSGGQIANAGVAAFRVGALLKRALYKPGSQKKAKKGIGSLFRAK